MTKCRSSPLFRSALIYTRGGAKSNPCFQLIKLPVSLKNRNLHIFIPSLEGVGFSWGSSQNIDSMLEIMGNESTCPAWWWHRDRITHQHPSGLQQFEALWVLYSWQLELCFAVIYRDRLMSPLQPWWHSCTVAGTNIGVHLFFPFTHMIYAILCQQCFCAFFSGQSGYSLVKNPSCQFITYWQFISVVNIYSSGILHKKTSRNKSDIRNGKTQSQSQNAVSLPWLRYWCESD